MNYSGRQKKVHMFFHRFGYQSAAQVHHIVAFIKKNQGRTTNKKSRIAPHKRANEQNHAHTAKNKNKKLSRPTTLI